MENPVVHDAQSATDPNAGFSIFHIRFFICHLPDVSEPRAVATGSGDNSNKDIAN
jgi:hypothetical protein